MRVTKLILLLSAVVLAVSIVAVKCEQEEDDFAEFDDDFEEDELSRARNRRGKSPPPPGKASADEPEVKEVPKKQAQAEDPIEEDTRPRESTFDEDDETNVINDEDDFESIDDEDEFDFEGDGKIKREMPPPKLTITSVPMPMRGWQAYWSELLMLVGIAVYMMNYILGRYKNQRIAQSFFDINWNILEDNFMMLGDSAILEDEQGTRNYQKMSDSIYQMWCSGRVCCEGMLVELKLLKRQDLVSILANMFRPATDVLRVSVEMGKEDMDSIVFALANRKTAAKMSKEYNDLINYCPDKKPADKHGLPSQFIIMSELSEAASTILDSKTCAVINKFADLIDSIHFTDQFTGLRSAEPETTKDGVMKLPEARRFLFFTLNLPTTSSGNNCDNVFEELKSFFQFIFYTIDKMKRVRLSKEGKMKADRNRAKVEEAFMKQTHAARAEAAAARREEKRRQEKERILQEDDPEKQRRWEEKEQKREKKRKQPKMKQLKVH